MKKTAILLLLIAVLPLTELLAQSGGYAGSFSRMGFSPRGMGMGNAMTAVQSEGSYSYYNPALSAQPTEHIQFDLSTAALRFDRRLHMAHSHFNLPPSAGLSLSIINAGVSDIDGRTQSGYHTDYLSTNEYQFLGNFALRFTHTFWGGIGLKYNLSSFHRDIPNSSSIGLDLGFRLQIHPKIAAGFTIQDIIAEQNANTSDLYGTERTDNAQPYPVRFIAGLSVELTDSWLFSFDLENRRQKAEIVRPVTGNENGTGQAQRIREDQTTHSRLARAGTRYHIHERLTLRGGLQLLNIGEENVLQPSAGFSIHLPYDRFSPSIDYAFMREPSQLSTMHIFAIKLHI